MSAEPAIRVVITTFQHEGFIARAVESVLDQETNFPVELIVIDDCSTDGTAGELDRLSALHPGRFEVRRPPENRNDLYDFGHALDEATTPYLAMLDGDDYWTSPTKLAQQVAFLDAHPEFAIAAHVVQEVDHDGVPHPSGPQLARTYTRDDMWSSCHIHTGSVVFRRSAFDRLPAWYYESIFGDWELYMLLLLRGDAWFAGESMCAYRHIRGGAWTALTLLAKAKQVHSFYVHQERVWGPGFRRNRTAMLSRAMTLEARYAQAGERLPGLAVARRRGRRAPWCIDPAPTARPGAT